MSTKLKVALLSGFLAGVATVFACGQLHQAHASPGDCGTWEYANIPIRLPSDLFSYTDDLNKSQPGSATVLPSGWEPFAANLGGALYMRRCKP